MCIKSGAKLLKNNDYQHTRVVFFQQKRQQTCRKTLFIINFMKNLLFMPDKLKLTILGRGAAIPSKQGNQSAQILGIHSKYMLIDCGEGTQNLIRQMDIALARLNHIFISHLHGDHVLGLPGLLSTLGMLGRKGTLSIYGHAELEKYLNQQIEFFGDDFGYPIDFHAIDPFHTNTIYEDKGMRVISFPLKHSIPCNGFVFEEKPKPLHLIKENADKYGVPVSQYLNIKNGLDYIKEDGTVIPNSELTLPADPCKKYVYCSDTAYNEKMLPLIENADCLYHEATFHSQQKLRAKETQHSTAAQAAEIARKAKVKQLIIGHISARYTDYTPLLEEAKSIFDNTILAEEKTNYWF